MEVDTGSLIVAAAAFIGNIVSPINAALMSASQAQKERRDQWESTSQQFQKFVNG
jgi:hypothetical protein